MPEQFTVGEVFGLLLVFARVGALISFLPGLSVSYVSIRIRLILALAVSMLVTPVLSGELPPLPASPVELILLLLGEITIGVFIAVLARIVFAALQAVGTFAAYYSSLASALVQDPIADQQSATLSGFLGTLGLVLIFVTDLHHLMLRAIVSSYALLPPGAPLPVDQFAEAIAHRVANSLVLAVQLSAPFLIAGLIYNIGLGLLGRMMPQLPVFFFGMPVQIAFQIWMIVLTLSGIMMVFLSRFADSLMPFGGP
jgi:flagellar biosynthetic protein FliR